MTWIPKESRWVKRINKPVKKSFYFAPKKHGLEPTEAGSRAGMRAWWAAQEAILNADVSEHEKELAKGMLAAVLKLRPLSEVETPLPVEDAAIARGLVIATLENRLDRLPSIAPFIPLATDAALGKGQHEKLMGLANEVVGCVVKPVEKSKLIGVNIDRWLAQKESEVKNGKLAAGSLRAYKGAINALKEQQGTTLVEAITNEWIQDRFNELSSLDLAPTSKNNRWECWRAFFDHLDTMGLIELPKILNKLSFPRDAKAKKRPWTKEEFQAAMAEADEVKQLVLLLAANCAFYASDICACYQHFDGKVLEMARVKTKKKCKPVVFSLWPETVKLLKKHGERLEGLYNTIHRWTFKTPLKQLRHTTKSFLLNSQYSQFTAYMTGEKGGSDNDLWYWTQAQEKLKEASEYLRSCYFG